MFDVGGKPSPLTSGRTKCVPTRSGLKSGLPPIGGDIERDEILFVAYRAARQSTLPIRMGTVVLPGPALDQLVQARCLKRGQVHDLDQPDQLKLVDYRK